MSDSINSLNESNRGGSANYLLYADIDKIDLANFPDESSGNINGDIPFLDEEDGFGKIALTIGTFSFHESEQKDGSWLTEMVGIIPKDRPALVALFQKQRKKRFIVIFPDNNAQAIIIGNSKEYCKMEVLERSSKKSPSERNDYKIRFTCLRRNQSPFYQGSI